MPRLLYALLVFVPAAAHYLGSPAWMVSAASAASLVPLAGLIGAATESLARRLGPRWGGLLLLAEPSITGSIIGNTLLVLGAALLAGGLRDDQVPKPANCSTPSRRGSATRPGSARPTIS